MVNWAEMCVVCLNLEFGKIERIDVWVSVLCKCGRRLKRSMGRED